MKIEVIFENPDMIVVNKPAGTLSQKDKSGDDDIASHLKAQTGRAGFLAPVHRLDRNTSGVLVLAKSSEAASKLTKAIKEGHLKREYLAIAKGDPGESGTFEFPLRKDEAKNQVFVDPNGQKAETHFSRLEKMGNSSLVMVRIITGRSHQIRIHFSHAGHALIGDKKYAKKPWSELFHRPALHAFKLTLPQGEELRAQVPEDFLELLRKLGGKSRF